MSPDRERLTEFEQRSRVVLEESVLRIDGRIRSRLNQGASGCGRGRAPPDLLAILHPGAKRRRGGSSASPDNGPMAPPAAGGDACG